MNILFRNLEIQSERRHRHNQLEAHSHGSLNHRDVAGYVYSRVRRSEFERVKKTGTLDVSITPARAAPSSIAISCCSFFIKSRIHIFHWHPNLISKKHERTCLC